MNQDEKLAKALERHRQAKLALPRLQSELARAEAEFASSGNDLMRVIKALGKVERQIVYAGEIYSVTETPTDTCVREFGDAGTTLFLASWPSNIDWIDGPDD